MKQSDINIIIGLIMLVIAHVSPNHTLLLIWGILSIVTLTFAVIQSLTNE